MEIIPPSTRPTEAITNAAKLLQIEDQCRRNFELRIWLDRVHVEVARLEAFFEEGSMRRKQTDDIHIQGHIDDLLAKLTDLLIRLDARIEIAEADIKRAELDDWSRPIDNRAAQMGGSPFPATSLISDIPSTRQSWTWKPGLIAGGVLFGVVLLGVLFRASIGPTELIIVPLLTCILVTFWGKLISRTGHNGWLCLLFAVPLIGSILIIIAALRLWPIEKERDQLRDRLEAIEQMRRAQPDTAQPVQLHS